MSDRRGIGLHISLPSRREVQAPAVVVESFASPDRETALGAYWSWRLRHIERARQQRYISPSNVAQIHMALGNKEEALAGLEAAFEERSGSILPFLAVDPLFDPLRGDPRFDDLVERIASGRAATADVARTASTSTGR